MIELFLLENFDDIKKPRRVMKYIMVCCSVGSVIYTPPNFKHSVKTDTGCVLLFIVPEEVEIIKKI